MPDGTATPGGGPHLVSLGCRISEIALGDGKGAGVGGGGGGVPPPFRVGRGGIQGVIIETNGKSM